MAYMDDDIDGFSLADDELEEEEVEEEEEF